MQAETTGARAHDDAVSVIETHVATAQFDDDVEDAVVVEQITEPPRGGEVVAESLAHDVVAGFRYAEHVDGDVQRLDVTGRQHAAGERGIPGCRSDTAPPASSVVGMLDGVEEGVDVVVLAADEPDDEPLRLPRRSSSSHGSMPSTL